MIYHFLKYIFNLCGIRGGSELLLLVFASLCWLTLFKTSDVHTAEQHSM